MRHSRRHLVAITVGPGATTFLAGAFIHFLAPDGDGSAVALARPRPTVTVTVYLDHGRRVLPAARGLQT
jgi:hypothetical protein